MKNIVKILVLVATNFEDVELITTLDVFKRANFEVVLISPEEKELVKGKYFAQVQTMKMSQLKSIDVFNGLFLPGGPGYKILLDNKDVISLIQKFKQKNKLITAICAAPEVLVKANVIDDNPISAYPGFGEIKNKVDKPLVINPKLITARDYQQTLPFALAIVKILGGKASI